MKSFQLFSLLIASLFLFPFTFSITLSAQILCEPGEALQVYETGKVMMAHGPNGRLWTPEHPMVLTDSVIAAHPINLFKNSGFWVAGVDPGGNVKGAVSNWDSTRVWYPGFLDPDGEPV